ncbi:sulfatase-like hydrolase/transferase [Candidatus Poribacteria bacterium]|nr:sulfatase-like hydrolase/transferase [Candidatus Poribacteria bacterium]
MNNTFVKNNQNPNIIFFFTDDQRFDTIHALGNDEIITPNIDSIVENGTTFKNNYIMGGTSGAVCMPSRAMLMTGRTLFHLERQGQNIPEDHIMLGETLQKAGYNTFGTGKWHNGTSSYARSFNSGGEIFFGGMDDHWNVPAFNFDPTGKYETRCNRTVDFVTQRVVQRMCDHIHAGKHSSELFCDATIDYLDSYEDDDPFFMYVSFMAPHDPRTMPKEYLDMYDPEQIKLPESFMSEHPFDNGELKIRDEMLAGFPRTPEEIKRHIAAYYAMITHADTQIGRVLKTLEETGKVDNTIIVFAGDNGLALGRHGLMGKQSVYEHSVKVPLVMSGPGVPNNTKSEAFTYLIDIYPTLCDLCNVNIPETVEGKSLVPAMSNPKEKIRENLLFAYTKLHRGVRDEQFKLIEYVVDGKRTTQLFDLKTDPHETKNLADNDDYSHVIEKLRKELVRWRDELDDTQEQGQIFWDGFMKV